MATSIDGTSLKFVRSFSSTWLEQRTHNPTVKGSSPLRTILVETIKFLHDFTEDKKMIDFSAMNKNELEDYNDKNLQVSVLAVLSKNGFLTGQYQYHFVRYGNSILGNPSSTDDLAILRAGMRVAQCYDENII